MPMTKQQAADFLGAKPRTLELYAQQGRLSVTYKKGERGRIAQYDEAELEKLKQELEQKSVYPQRAIIMRPNAGFVSIDEADLMHVFLTAYKAQRESERPQLDLTQVAHKLTLSLAEASALSGLSQHFLTAAIHDGKLKAAKRGRGWNIKRADLESYIKSL